MDLSGRVAVVGAYESPRRAAPGVHPFEIHAECVRAALDDAGLQLSDVDGFCTAAGDLGEGGAYVDLLDVADYLGLKPTYFDSTDIGGASYVSHAGHAAQAIATGQADVVVISYAACPRWWPVPSAFWDGLSVEGGTAQYELPYSPTLIGSFALLATRHMHDHGTTPEQLARIAVACRANARDNPHARYREPLTVEQVLESPLIASPLHKLDCCVITESGGAIVLTSAERARDCRAPAARVLGFGEAVDALSLSALPYRTTTPARLSSRRAFEMAGLGPGDIDAAQLYDGFTIHVLLELEDIGFCEPGGAGELIDSGALDPGGSLPVNTDGGGLSSNQSGRRGMYALIEAVRQLRGEGPGRQVPDCETVLVHGLGGIYSAGSTMILGRA